MNSEPSLASVPVLPLGDFILRPLRRGDSGPWFDYLSDRRTTDHTSWPEVSPPMVAAIVDRLIGEYTDRTSLRWALARADDDELVGTCGYPRFDATRASGELAYDLAPEYWGRGVMRRAVDAAVHWAFAEGGLRRVEAFVMVSNTRSIGLLERCGFAREQLFPAHRIARGVPKDFWRYGKESGSTPQSPAVRVRHAQRD